MSSLLYFMRKLNCAVFWFAYFNHYTQQRSSCSSLFVNVCKINVSASVIKWEPCVWELLQTGKTIVFDTLYALHLIRWYQSANKCFKVDMWSRCPGQGGSWEYRKSWTDRSCSLPKKVWTPWRNPGQGNSVSETFQACSEPCPGSSPAPKRPRSFVCYRFAAETDFVILFQKSV